MEKRTIITAAAYKAIINHLTETKNGLPMAIVEPVGEEETKARVIRVVSVSGKIFDPRPHDCYYNIGDGFSWLKRFYIKDRHGRGSNSFFHMHLEREVEETSCTPPLINPNSF